MTALFANVSNLQSNSQLIILSENKIWIIWNSEQHRLEIYFEHQSCEQNFNHKLFLKRFPVNSEKDCFIKLNNLKFRT